VPIDEMQGSKRQEHLGGVGGYASVLSGQTENEAQVPAKMIDDTEGKIPEK